MIGNIWFTSALIVATVFSTSAIYKSYTDIQEAKQIQENYQIISEIKELIAKQYNINVDEITRDHIVMHLPSGGNWEKVLLTDRNDSSTLATSEQVNDDGDFVISEDDKIKLFALKSKLKNILDVSTITKEDSETTYTIPVGSAEKNLVQNDEKIKLEVESAIEYLANNILYGTETAEDALVAYISTYNPENLIYHNLDTEDKKKDYFKNKIKEKLLEENSAVETRLYLELKDLL